MNRVLKKMLITHDQRFQ